MTAPAPQDTAVGRVSEWREIQAEKARAHARESVILSAVFSEALAECDGRTGPNDMRDIPIRSVIAEFSTAGRISSRTMEAAMWHAHALVTEFPITFQALENAQISPTHARIITDAGAQIDDQESRFAYEIAAVDYASGESPNRVRSVARMLAAKHGGVTAAERRKRAHEGRRLWVDDFDDGSAELHLRTSSVLAHAAVDRATQLARMALDPNSSEQRQLLGDVEKDPIVAEDENLIPERDVQNVDDEGVDAPGDDPRTMDHARADVVIDLLLAAAAETVRAPGAESIQAHIQVTLPAAVLAGISDAPAELFGCGPVDAGVIREIAGLAAGWDRLYLDGYSGIVTATDRYRPTAEMRRFLRARDNRCRFPGCAASVWRCDLDHTHEHSKGGPTECGNLSHLCRRHHSLKHPDVADEYRWSARQLSSGRIEWTSPHGEVFIDHPPPRVQFS